MDNFETHVLRVSVLVKKIQLSVRFQCLLSFQLKADSATSENLKHYNLNKGQCLVNQTVSVQAQLLFNRTTQKYSDKKIYITVYMNNSHRKVPGGTALCIITNDEIKKNVEKTAAMEKCPDKAAKIIFTQTIQFLRKSDSPSKNAMKYGGFTSLSSNNILSTPYRQRSDMPPNSQRRPSRNKNNFGGQFIQSEKKMYQPYASKVVSFNVDDKQKNSYQQQKFFRLERQKIQLMKQLAKKSNEIDQLTNKLSSRKTEQELQQLTDKFQRIKQNLRIHQRRQRQFNMVIKQLKQEIQQKKIKIRNSQRLVNQKQIQLTQKEKSIKDLEIVKKKLEEKIQDMNLEIMSSIKRVQLKEQSFKEQLQKLTEKYNQCENQRSQSMQELNKILSEMQNLEKKNQITIKQRDRTFYEEKVKFIQQIEQGNKKIATLEEQLQEKNSQLIQINQIEKKTHLSQQQKAQEIVQLAQSLQKQKNKLNKQIQIRKTLEMQNASLKITEEEKNSLKKKYNETNNELLKAREKINEITLKLNNQMQKVKNLEENLKVRNEDKQQLENKLTNLNKELEKQKKNQQRQTREAETMSVQNTNYNQKLLQLKDKLYMQVQKNNEMQMQFNDQLTFLNRTKQNLQSQLDETKWSLQRAKETNQSILQKMKILNQEKIKVHKENIESGQKAKKVLEEINQLKIQKDNLQTRIKNMMNKEKQSYTAMQQKFNELFQKDKKIHSLENQINKLNDKVKNYEIFYQDKLGTEQSLAKQKEMIALQKTEELGQLQLEIFRKNQEIFAKDQNINLKQHQLQLIKEQFNGLKNSNQNYQGIIQQLRLQLEVNIEKNSQLANKITQKTDLLNSTQLSLKKLKQQFEQFKKANNQAFSHFIEQIGSDEESIAYSSSIVTFPDLSLCMLQMEAIKKKNHLLNSYKQQLKQLTSQKQIAQSNLKRHQQSFSERESELQKQIQKLKMKIEQQINSNSASKHEHFLSEQLTEEKINQYMAQIEKISQQNVQYRQAIDLWKLQNQKLSAQCIQNINQLKVSQDEINRLNTQLQKLKTFHQNKLNSISDMSTSYEEKSKSTISQLQKKVNSLQNTLQNREQAIKANLKEISQLTYSNDKQSEKIQQQKQKIEALNLHLKKLQKQKNTFEKNIQTLTENQQKLERNLQQQQLQMMKLQKRATIFSEENSLTKVQLGKQRARVKQLEGQLQSLIQRIREKSSNGKLFNEKYTNQVNSFQQKIADLKAQIQLKDFEGKQHKENIKRLNQIIGELEKNIQKRKTDILKAQSKIQELTQQLFKFKQDQEINTKERQSLSNNLQRAKSKSFQLQVLQAEHQSVLSLLQSKEQDLMKTKQQLENCLLLLDKNTVDFKSSMADTKKQLVTKHSRQQQLRKRVRDLEDQLQEKQEIIYNLQRQLLTESQKDKKDTQSQIKNLQIKFVDLQKDYQRQKAKFLAKIDQLTMQCLQLEGMRSQKQQVIQTQALQLKQYELRIEDLTKQLKDCIQIWDKQKSMQSSKKLSSAKRYEKSNETGFLSKHGQLSKSKKLIESLNSSGVVIDEKKSGKQVTDQVLKKPIRPNNPYSYNSSAR